MYTYLYVVCGTFCLSVYLLCGTFKIYTKGERKVIFKLVVCW